MLFLSSFNVLSHLTQTAAITAVLEKDESLFVWSSERIMALLQKLVIVLQEDFQEDFERRLQAAQ